VSGVCVFKTYITFLGKLIAWPDLSIISTVVLPPSFTCCPTTKSAPDQDLLRVARPSPIPRWKWRRLTTLMTLSQPRLQTVAHQPIHLCAGFNIQLKERLVSYFPEVLPARLSPLNLSDLYWSVAVELGMHRLACVRLLVDSLIFHFCLKISAFNLFHIFIICGKNIDFYL
jgi:hypothetical protein